MRLKLPYNSFFIRLNKNGETLAIRFMASNRFRTAIKAELLVRFFFLAFLCSLHEVHQANP